MVEELGTAEALLSEGHPADALAVLHAAQPTLETLGPSHPDMRRLMQLKTACVILTASKGGSSWWKAFALDPTTATPSTIRREYRRLAALVHPDKAAFAGATDAFNTLQSGMAQLLIEIDDGSEPSSSRKRAKWEGDTDAYDEDDAGGEHGGGDGDEFAWWTEWDHAAGGQERAAPHAEPEERDAKESEARRDVAALREMSVDALRQEVRRRQDALLTPSSAAAAAPTAGADYAPQRQLTMAELRVAMARARTVLNEKLLAAQTEDEADAAAGWAGGFIPG